MAPFLTVITRCYKRPKMLRANVASLEMQTDQDYEQLFIVDEVGRGVQWANEQFAVHTDRVNGEYVLLLDDDDKLVDREAVAKLKAAARRTGADIVVFRVDHGPLGILPDAIVWEKEPVHCHIGGGDLIVKADLWRRCIEYFGHAVSTISPGGDFSFMRELWSHNPRVCWLDKVLEEVQRISRGAPEPEDPRLCVLLCVWQRPERLDLSLEMLGRQADKAFDLYLVNNNVELCDLVNETALRFTGRLNVKIRHNVENRLCMARVEVAHQLACDGTVDYPFYIFLDDDLDIGKDWIAECRREATSDALVGWRAWLFDGNYWQRHAAEIGGPAHLVTGAGMIAPAAVLAHPGVLDLPFADGCMDDLWLSYVANHVLHYRLTRGTFSSVSVVNDGKDCYVHYHQQKIDMLERLRRNGWAV